MNPQKDKGYFPDGRRKIHYVLVTHEENLPKLKQFLNNLRRKDIDIEITLGRNLYYLLFILLHLPEKVHKSYAEMYDVQREVVRTKFEDLHILKSYHFKKLPPLLNPAPSGALTNSQCITILYQILESTEFGDGAFDYSLTKLAEKDIITDSYPLHDGPLNYHFDEFDRMSISSYNDRELLYRYWASFRVWKYEVPLDLIKKYYGPEMAFYFHWLEYLILMLCPMAVLGTVVFLISIILVRTKDVHNIEEVCTSTVDLCPKCLLKILCYFKPLKEYCSLFMWTYIFDNYLTVIFAVLISFWGTFFTNIWIRRTNELKIRWDIQEEGYDLNIRREYAENVKRYREDDVTGELEPCMHPIETALRYLVVTIIGFFVCLTDLAVVYGLFYFELTLKIFIVLSPIHFSKNEKRGVIILTSSLLLIVAIKIKSKMIPNISRWLTDFSMHKTQQCYERALLYTIYLLSFSNNYAVLFYTAFVKGSFNTSPKSTVSTTIMRDSCQPLPCILDLASKIFFVLIFRRLLLNILMVLLSIIFRLFKNRFQTVAEVVGQYEDEYWLNQSSKGGLNMKYNELVIQYGLVTFFGAAFPLAPVFVLLDNLIELRLSASALVKNTRRPVPKEIPGMTQWQKILMGLIYFNTAVNALVIAFSTMFVSREVYSHKNSNSLEGFVYNYTLSAFLTKDSKIYETIEGKPEYCYYLGMREPPNNPNKYRLTSEFWEDFTWKMVFVVCFEVRVSNYFPNIFIFSTTDQIKNSMVSCLPIRRND
ncbi:unnamed protein product [Phyllotreta striolata]|uniref:Anoctamin n=1 Tax=Phyllotreta striolata TaxID=444603 RepID=A0A9N9TEM5_PHYSR|nr:unnamed protein product [Phyllotreta striolata]